MRRYYALLGALTFSVICTSLYLMTENLANNSQHTQFEPNKVEISDVDSRIKIMESRLRYNEKILGILKEVVANVSDPKKVDKLLAMQNSGIKNIVDVKDKPVISYPQDMCTFSASSTSKSDIQMLDVFAEIGFENPDGGAWKQGYPITYDNNQWDQEKLLVFVVPHSHNDPGWIKTFQQYYQDQTRFILDNMLRKLEMYPKMRFIFAEISYFSQWWDEIDSVQRESVKKLIAENRLELVTGGWVMTDEANAHYYAMIDQLIEGNQWMMSEIGVKPANGWSIDPFGYSSTMPYLLKKAGFQNMLIQRVHYAIKKHFSLKRSLEFNWRQNWDSSDATDIFCHMMPFYSYDVPHTCGPEPAICCQFDFKRLPGDRITCPWHIPPVPINNGNVAERAFMLLDQYRKKAQLYRGNVVLAPLGDDFRYDKDSEWEAQYHNYQQLFDYMNGRTDWHVEAKFGTLSDYFRAVRERSGAATNEKPKGFPVLSGDFFTYSDREDNYWSGYFTSRPFYKRMDRVVESHLRGSEVLFSLASAYIKHYKITNFATQEIIKSLTSARRSLGLFQHHDGITGTAKDFVVADYGAKLLNALSDTKRVMQLCSHLLLTSDKSKYAQTSTDATYFNVDELRSAHDSLPEKTTIQVGNEPREVVFYNSLSHIRTALVRLHVSDPYVVVKDNNGQVVTSQVDPYWISQENYADSIYKVTFVVIIPPLGLVRYTLTKSSSDDSQSSVLSHSVIYNAKASIPERQPFTVESKSLESFSTESNDLKLEFNGQTGLLKTILLKRNNQLVDINLKFLQYGTRDGKERSGAYLFLPDGAAQEMNILTPTVRVVRGLLQSEVHVFLSQVEHIVRISNAPGVEGLGVDIHNLVDVRGESNKELVMRLQTSISNKERTFFSDLNGFQMQQRRTMDKIPLQANFYPMAAASYLEDDINRVTVLSGQALGVASLQTGWLEIMQDRRLNQDDGRGLGQGVLDNKRTPNIFRIVVESNSYKESQEAKPTGYLSTVSNLLSRELIHPIHVFPRRDAGGDVMLSSSFVPLSSELPCELHLVNLRTLANKEGEVKDVAAILHHVGVDCRYPNMKFTCSLQNGKLEMQSLLKDLKLTSMTSSSLSLLEDGSQLSPTADIQVPPMEIVAYKLNTE